ncbi:MAG TPA: hypothetical protein DD614_03335 [Clostridiales bacterium]|nr:hypothetical protein [Clostridiales bacterium]
MIEEEKNEESIIDKNIDLSEDKNIENQDENDSEFKLTFKLENFSGPLDLLLTLIKKSKLDIEDIQISDLTEQYLDIMKDISKVDMEVASEFIEYAALLIEIKSKKLLPKIVDTEEDELDPEYILKLRLREYQMFKEVNEKLGKLESNDKFYKAPEKEANKFRIIIKDMELDKLLDAFVGIMHRVNKIEKSKESKEIIKETFTVEQKISSIKDTLISRSKLKFSELFLDTSSRDEVITTFMALLELIKMQVIRVSQDDLFSDIQIEKTGDEINGELI